MKPAEICLQTLGQQKLACIIDELSSPQIKAVLKQGAVRVKLPGGFVSQQKRRTIWSSKILGEIEQQNEALCAELLQQWLLNHRRPMLIAYLDHLAVRHRDGETDESFLVAKPGDAVRDAAEKLLASHDPVEARAYLIYVAYQQRSTVFDGWPLLQGSLTSVLPTATETAAQATSVAAPEPTIE